MARKLKTYQAALGFFDTAIAAPSMKAALEAWGSNSNLFHQGLAKEPDDPDVVAATMAKPGVILKRPIGSHKPFEEETALPGRLPSSKKKHRRSTRQPASNANRTASRKAVLAYQREERKRERQQRREELAAAKDRERRKRAAAKAEAALDTAKLEHDEKAKKIEIARARLEKRSQTEDRRWEKQRAKLQHAIRKAHP